MKPNTRRKDSSKRRKSTAARPSRATIQKKSASGGKGGGTSSHKAALRPTYFSLLKDVEHALKYEHMEGASLQKIRRHMEKRYGGRTFDTNTCKMLRAAVKRLQNKGRIRKHPTSNLYKFKPPIVPAHHIFGTKAQRRAAKAQSRAPPSRKQSSAKNSRPNRSSKPTRRR